MPSKTESTKTINTELADALKSIAEVIKENRAAESEREANLVGAAVKEARKPAENKAPPKMSDFNPQGDKDYPRPELKVAKMYCPFEIDPESFSYEELELLNLVTPGVYSVTRTDMSKGQLVIKGVRSEVDGKLERIEFESPSLFSQEHKGTAPPLVMMLREILGDKAKDVMTMAERRQKVLTGELPVSVGN